MRRLRTLPTRRLLAIVAGVAALAVTAGIAQAALSGGVTKPQPKTLARAIRDALRAPQVKGVTARIHFTNNLLPSGALPEGGTTPLATGADGRLWMTADGRARLELQSDAGDAQIVYDGKQLTVYDASSKTVYRLPVSSGHESPAEKRKPEHKPTLANVKTMLRHLARDWHLSGAQPSATGGRPSYTVKISPKDDGGLLGAARFAWDAATGAPLRAAVYAQGQSAPVLELKATHISYGHVPTSAVTLKPPPGAKTVDVSPPPVGGAHANREQRSVAGVKAVQRRLSFRLAAPAKLAGLPRQAVRLTRSGGQAGALATYGRGLGAVVVFEHKADGAAQPQTGGTHQLQLPTININGATGTEIATALGTVLTFQRGHVAYVVAGSVPPAAAESAARGLR
jgi:outer membrane lipoprotein-sorting protein